MIITSQNITLGDFTFKFEFGTASRRFYITPVYFKNKIIKCEEFDTEFESEFYWFNCNERYYIKKNNESYKITECFCYTTYEFNKDVELKVADEKGFTYTTVINKESFVIFIKLLIFYYEHCNNER